MTAQKFDDAQSLISYVLDNGPKPDDDAAAVVNGFLRCEQYAHVLDWYMLSVPETLDDSDIVGTIRAISDCSSLSMPMRTLRTLSAWICTS